MTREPGRIAGLVSAMRRRPVGVVGIAILAALLVTALGADVISPYDPNERVGVPYEVPSGTHLLGTNDVGQDLLAELIYGSRMSLLIGTIAALAAVGIGTLVGLLAGYFGGPIDSFLMRVTDVVLVVPFLPLMIMLAAFIGPSLMTLILVIAILVWPQTARVVRSRVLTLRRRAFVEAGIAMGASHWRVLFRYLLPMTLPLSLAQFVLVAASTILIEASLAFLGLGDPNAESWGSMLYWAQARGAFLGDSWLWWVLPPGIAIALTVLGFTYLGSILEDALDPRLSRR